MIPNALWCTECSVARSNRFFWSKWRLVTSRHILRRLYAYCTPWRQQPWLEGKNSRCFSCKSFAKSRVQRKIPMTRSMSRKWSVFSHSTPNSLWPRASLVDALKLQFSLNTNARALGSAEKSASDVFTLDVQVKQWNRTCNVFPFSTAMSTFKNSKAACLRNLAQRHPCKDRIRASREPKPQHCKCPLVESTVLTKVANWLVWIQTLRPAG